MNGGPKPPFFILLLYYFLIFVSKNESSMLFSIILFFCIALTIAAHCIYGLVWLVGKCARFYVPYKPFGWAALILVIICIAFICYGFFIGRFKSEIKEVTFENENLPKVFDGYRIVQISDLHLLGFKGYEDKLKLTFDKVNGLHPDMICFTGDLVSFSADEIAPFAEMLRGLRASDGFFSVLGNHDYATYDYKINKAERDAKVAELIRTERDVLGWNLLLDESSFVVRGGDTLTVIGCQNQSCAGKGISPVQRGNLKKAMQKAHGFCILLTHDPTHWRGEVLDTEIPLTLSGHTHAAQFRIFGWTPAKWFYPDSDGMYVAENQALYVNTGIGCTVPFRIGVPQEITLITLKKD